MLGEKINKALTSPLFHAGVGLLSIDDARQGPKAALQGASQGRQLQQQAQEQQRLQEERERQKALAQQAAAAYQSGGLKGLGTTLLTDPSTLASGAGLLGKVDPSTAAGSIGTYNPRDYTTESWTQFVQTRDPSTLQRYGGTLEERMAADPEFAAAVNTYLEDKARRVSAATEKGKSEVALEMEPKIASAVERAKGVAQRAIETASEQRSNDAAYRTYEAAMRELASSMGQTVTGPIAGWFPSITANAQIAEGAVAVMAPVLKSIFRTSGEGTFTDKDQEMLLAMVPTRKDHPEARAAKISMINSIVMSKLGQGQSTTPSAGGQAVLPPVNERGWRLMEDANGNKAYVGPNNQVEEVQ